MYNNHNIKQYMQEEGLLSGFPLVLIGITASQMPLYC